MLKPKAHNARPNVTQKYQRYATFFGDVNMELFDALGLTVGFTVGLWIGLIVVFKCAKPRRTRVNLDHVRAFYTNKDRRF